nr:hypothetical protein [Staphylococcus haemolyticus]
MLHCIFFNGTATTDIYTLSLHDALPFSGTAVPLVVVLHGGLGTARHAERAYGWNARAEIGRAHV